MGTLAQGPNTATWATEILKTGIFTGWKRSETGPKSYMEWP